MFSFETKLSSLILYIVVFATSSYMLTSASNAKSTSSRRLCLLLAVLLPSILSCFRICGTDLGTNHQIFVRISSFPWNMMFSGYDPPFYFLLMKLSGILGGIRWFLLLLALIPCACICKTLYDFREKLDLNLAYTAFLFGCLVSSWNVSRQYVAVGITCLAVRYIFSRQLYKFLFCIGLAYLFHPSCLVMLAVYPLWTREGRLPTGWKLFLYYVLAVAFVLNVGYFAGKLSGDLESYNNYLLGDDRGKNRDFYVNLLWLFLFVYNRKKLVELNPRNDFFLALFGLTCIIGLTGFFSPIIKRTAFYFSVYRCVLIGSLPLAFQKKGNQPGVQTERQGAEIPEKVSFPGLFQGMFKAGRITPMKQVGRRIPIKGSFLKTFVGVRRAQQFTSMAQPRRTILPKGIFIKTTRKLYTGRRLLQTGNPQWKGSFLVRLKRTYVLQPFTSKRSSEREVPAINVLRETPRSNQTPLTPRSQDVRNSQSATVDIGASDMLRVALYLAVFGLFFLTAYILGQAEVLPYRHTDWDFMLE